MNKARIGWLMWIIQGCAGWEPEARARDQAREWLECDEVALEPVGESAYRATGCGRTLGVACATSTNEPHCTRVRIASAGGDEPASPPAPVQGAVATETAVENETETDSQLRATLDARREDVLACVSRERVVVRATWTAMGEVSWALDGELRGSPEEGCVRAALGALRVDAPNDGTLLHLVRR